VLYVDTVAIILTPLATQSASSYLLETDPLRVKRKWIWRAATRPRGGGGGSSHETALRLLGHLLSTALVYLALLLLTWGVSQCFTFLIDVGPLPEDAAQFLARLKLAILYGEGSLFSYFWATGAWHLFKEMKR
jgi:hypothetical protein